MTKVLLNLLVFAENSPTVPFPNCNSAPVLKVFTDCPSEYTPIPVFEAVEPCTSIGAAIVPVVPVPILYIPTAPLPAVIFPDVCLNVAPSFTYNATVPSVFAIRFPLLSNVKVPVPFSRTTALLPVPVEVIVPVFSNLPVFP